MLEQRSSQAFPAIVSLPEIDALIDAHAPVAIGVSGGKDSQAAALATFDYLHSRHHRGPRVLIHSDLGRVEWNESLPVCERLAAHLGCELIVVRRKAGDMLDRWQSRWASSVRRYEQLETVTVVLPWSTPSMRFCTSELKTHVIAAELRRRFKGLKFINVTGVRRQESAARARGSIASLESDGKAWSWRPISDWTTEQVFDRIKASGLAAHEAYTRYGLSRTSCRFCIMSSLGDLNAAAAAPESHELYREMVALEARSTFAFQGNRWLGDIAPALLPEGLRADFALAKTKAAQRVALESRIPKDLLYTKGWPTRMPSVSEAVLLADVRSKVSSLLAMNADFLAPSTVLCRYEALMAARQRAESKEAA